MLEVQLKIIKADSLLTKIKASIDDQQIVTWEYDEDDDFTAIQPQWNREAWMHPYIVNNKCIQFGIVQRRDVPITSDVYAVYHGRFAEMLLMHFDKYILNIEISSLLVAGVDVFETE